MDKNPAPISHGEYHMSYSVLTRPNPAHYIGSLEYKILGQSVHRLSQTLTFKLLGVTCLIAKIEFQLIVNWWLRVGGLDSWDPLKKGIATWGYPDANPQTTRPQTI